MLVAEALGDDARLGSALGGAEDREQRREALRRRSRCASPSGGPPARGRSWRPWPGSRSAPAIRTATISDASNSVALDALDGRRPRRCRATATAPPSRRRCRRRGRAIRSPSRGPGSLRPSASWNAKSLASVMMVAQRAALGAVGLAPMRRAARRAGSPRASASAASLPAPGSARRRRPRTGIACSSRVQKAWMVCTFRPPGVSSASANSLRARASRLASTRLTPVLRISFSSASSSSVVQPASRSNTRFAMLADAALV